MSNKEIEAPEDEQELYEHHRIVAEKGQSLIRIDKFLMSRIENASRSKIQNAAEANCILVNGKPAKSNYRVKPGDVMTVLMPHPPREVELIPENIPLNIVYEDEDLVIVNKEPGMVVHPAYGNYSGTLINALVYHFQNLPISKKKKETATEKKKGKMIDAPQTTGHTPELRPGLVHRIDKNTSGILVIAKTEIAMTKLAKCFFDRTIDRTYIALVWGDFAEDSGTITGNIGRSLKDRKVMAIFPDGDFGKHAVTHYKVLERFGYVTLIECKLETGRTHQIRVHLQHIGHALFNDDTYGGDRILKGTTFTKYKQFVENCFKIMPRHALHAKSLGFVHPTTNEYVFFDSELPLDMATVIEKWRAYSSHKNLLEG